MQISGFHVGLMTVGPKEMPAVQNLLQPCSGSYYKKRLLIPIYWYVSFSEVKHIEKCSCIIYKDDVCQNHINENQN